MLEDTPEIAFDPEDEGFVAHAAWLDPTKIHVEQRSVNLGTLLGMLQGRQIIFDTEFQRNGDLWKPVEKSRLIESVLLGIPLPSFFFSERENSLYEWEIIDGLQRLCAFQDFFIDKTLKLTGLDFLHEYEGKTYDDFSSQEQWRMNMLNVTLNVVTRSTPGYVKYMIFKRVNSVSYVLTPQEMRHALIYGKPANFVKELAETKAFKRATANTEFKRMADRELVTRYLAFRLLDYEGDCELNDFLYKGMEHIYKLDNQRLDEERKLFVQVLETADAIFYGKAFRKPAEGNRTNPISKALFDAVTICLSRITQEQRCILQQRKELFYGNFVKMYRKSPDFQRDLTTGTAQKTAVIRRWKTMDEIINSTLP